MICITVTCLVCAIGKSTDCSVVRDNGDAPWLTTAVQPEKERATSTPRRGGWPPAPALHHFKPTAMIPSRYKKERAPRREAPCRNFLLWSPFALNRPLGLNGKALAAAAFTLGVGILEDEARGEIILDP